MPLSFLVFFCLRTHQNNGAETIRLIICSLLSISTLSISICIVKTFFPNVALIKSLSYYGADYISTALSQDKIQYFSSL